MQIAMDRLLLKLPVFGDLINKSVIARWTRTLSTMFAAGVPLVEALDSVGGALGQCGVRRGHRADPARRLHRLRAHHVDAGHRRVPEHGAADGAIGEESGSLDHMLGKAAEFYEDEVDEMVKGLSSLMEPFIIVILGTIIGGIVVSMYLPIFKLGAGGLTRSAGICVIARSGCDAASCRPGPWAAGAVHRQLPQRGDPPPAAMLERQWWAGVAQQLRDARDSAAPSLPLGPPAACSEQAGICTARHRQAGKAEPGPSPGRAARPAATSIPGTRTSRCSAGCCCAGAARPAARASACATRWSRLPPALLFAAVAWRSGPTGGPAGVVRLGAALVALR
jgi:hypothetical protein